MMEHMPERSVLAAIANTEDWTHWGRTLDSHPDSVPRSKMPAIGMC